MSKAGFNAEFSVGAGPSVHAKAQDVDFEAEADEIEITNRSSAGWAEYISGIKKWKMGAVSLWVPDDVAFELIEAAYIAGSPIAVKMLVLVSGHGWSGSAIVTKIGRAEPLKGALTVTADFRGTGALTRVDPS